MLSSFSLALLTRPDQNHGNRGNSRTKIKLLVTLLPGLQLRELQRLLGISFNTMRCHVDKLASAGESLRLEQERYSRIYPKQICNEDRILLSIVRRSSNFKILASMLAASS